MRVVPAAIIIAPVSLRADRSAGHGANASANRRSAAAANCTADHRAGAGAKQRAADCIALRIRATRRDCDRGQGRHSEKSLPHDMLPHQNRVARLHSFANVAHPSIVPEPHETCFQS